MNRCAGVQNVSRPIDICHEMSQYTPTITHVAPRRTVYACQSVDVPSTLRSAVPTVAPGWIAIAIFGMYCRMAPGLMPDVSPWWVGTCLMDSRWNGRGLT